MTYRFALNFVGTLAGLLMLAISANAAMAQDMAAETLSAPPNLESRTNLAAATNGAEVLLPQDDGAERLIDGQPDDGWMASSAFSADNPVSIVIRLASGSTMVSDVLVQPQHWQRGARAPAIVEVFVSNDDTIENSDSVGTFSLSDAPGWQHLAFPESEGSVVAIRLLGLHREGRPGLGEIAVYAGTPTLAAADNLPSEEAAAAPSADEFAQPLDVSAANDLLILALHGWQTSPDWLGEAAPADRTFLALRGTITNLSDEKPMSVPSVEQVFALQLGTTGIVQPDAVNQRGAYPFTGTVEVPAGGHHAFTLVFAVPEPLPETTTLVMSGTTAQPLFLPLFTAPGVVAPLGEPIAETATAGLRLAATDLVLAHELGDMAAPADQQFALVDILVERLGEQALITPLADFAMLVEAGGYIYAPHLASQALSPHFYAPQQYNPGVVIPGRLAFLVPRGVDSLSLLVVTEEGPLTLDLTSGDGVEGALPTIQAMSGDDGRITLSLLGIALDETDSSRVLLDLTARLNHDDPIASMDLDLSEHLELHDSAGTFTKAVRDVADVPHLFGPSLFFAGQPVRGTLAFPLPPGSGPYRLLLPFAENPVSLDIPTDLMPQAVASVEESNPEPVEPAETEASQPEPTVSASSAAKASETTSNTSTETATPSPSQTRAELGPFALSLLGSERTPGDNGTDTLRLSLRLENVTDDTVYNLVPADYLRLRENGAYLVVPDAQTTEPSPFDGDVELSPGTTADGHATFAVPHASTVFEIVLLTEVGPLVLPVEGSVQDIPLTEPVVPPVQAEVGGGVAVTLHVFPEPSTELYANLPAPPDDKRYLVVDLALGMAGGDPLTTLPLDPAANIRLVGESATFDPVAVEPLPHALETFELWGGLSHRGLIAFLVPANAGDEVFGISIAGLLESEVPMRRPPAAVTPEKSVITLGSLPESGEANESSTIPDAEAEPLASTPEKTTITLPVPEPPADIPDDLELAKTIGVFDESLDTDWNLVRDSFAYHVTGTDYPAYLGDGDFYSHDFYTTNRVGESFVIKIIEPMLVSDFNIKLWDGDDRYFQYRIEYSENGADWVMLADRSEGEQRGWQDFEVNAVAQYFRVTGLYSSANEHFHLMEAEVFAARPLDLRREVASAQRGGRLVDVTPTIEGDDGRSYLIDGLTNGYYWRSPAHAPGEPVEITLGFVDEALLPIHALLLYPAGGDADPSEAPKSVEVLATTGGANGAFSSLGVFELDSQEGPQLISFDPQWARHIKLRMTDNFGGETFALNEIRVFEANQDAPASVSDGLIAHVIEGDALPFERDLTFYLNGGKVEALPAGQQDLLALIDRDPQTGYTFAAHPDPDGFIVSFFAGQSTLIDSLAIQLGANDAQGLAPGRLSVAVATETPDGPYTEVADVLLANTDAIQFVHLVEPAEARYVKVSFSSPIEGGQMTILGLAVYESDDLGGALSALHVNTEPPADIGPNIARDAFGGEVISVTSYFEEWMPPNGLQALIDENALIPAGWRAGDAPDQAQDIVIGFVEGRKAKIAAVSLMSGTYNDVPGNVIFGAESAHRFEIWVSDSSPTDGWRQIGSTYHLRNAYARQYFELPEPVEAKYVKVRILDNYHGEWLYLGDIGIHEAPETGGYTSILADKPVNLADPRFGGSLIRYTSQYDENWSAYNLVDGGVETNGWSSLDDTLPQRFLFAFDQFQIALISSVAIDQRILDDTLYAASEIKVAVTTEKNALAEFETVGVFEIGADGRQVIMFDAPVEARFLEISVLARHGTEPYTAIGEIEIHEAKAAGYQSIIDRENVVEDDGEAGGTNTTELLTASTEEDETNNQRNTATVLELGQETLARVDPVGDLDVFRIDLNDSGRETLNLRLDGAPFIKQYLSVENETGEVIFTFDPRQAGQTQNFTILAPPGDYFVEVSEPTTSVVLVFDSSGSMDGNVDALKQAADRYIADKEPHEEMAIVRFNHNVDVLSDFTIDSDALRNAVQGQLFADGGTALYLALFRAMELLETREGNRAIVLLSDGADSGDGAFAPEFWQKLEDAGIRLFSVGLGSGLTDYTPSIAAKPNMALQAWSWSTGGEFFFAPDASELLEVYSSVSEQLRGQSNYRLTATVPEGDGAVSVTEVGERITGVTGPSRLVMIFDASNSMNGAIAGLGPKINVAKDVMQDIVYGLPEGLQVGLRVYGHRISRHEKARSCNDTELVVPFGPLDRAGLISAVDAITPQGQTPIGRSLRQLAADFGDSEGPKLVLLISDGIESCDDDPTSPDYPPRVVQELNDAGLEIVVNIVGFDITENNTREFLQGIAEMTGGQLYTADNSDELRGAIEQAMRAGFQVLDSVGNPVAQGNVGAGPVTVPEGVYQVVVDSDPLIEIDDVEVVWDKETRLLVNKEGEELTTDRELLDEISEAPVLVASLPPVEPIVLEDVDPTADPIEPVATAEPTVDDEDRAMVQEAQSLLAQKGYDPGPADGLMGPQTREAIRHFQRDAGLSESGEVDTALLEQLRSYKGQATVLKPTVTVTAPETSKEKSNGVVVIGTLTDILDTAHLIVDGQIIRLAGVAQNNEAYIVRAMQDNLPGLELVCAESQIAGLDGFFCLDYDGLDIGEEMLRRGIARALSNAPSYYLTAQDQARRDGAGVWD